MLFSIFTPQKCLGTEEIPILFFFGIPLDSLEFFVVSLDEAGIQATQIKKERKPCCISAGFVEKSKPLCASHGLLASCSSTQVERELGLPKKTTTLKGNSYLKTSKSQGARQQAEAKNYCRNIQLHLSEEAHSLLKLTEPWMVHISGVFPLCGFSELRANRACSTTFPVCWLTLRTIYSMATGSARYGILALWRANGGFMGDIKVGNFSCNNIGWEILLSVFLDRIDIRSSKCFSKWVLANLSTVTCLPSLWCTAHKLM